MESPDIVAGISQILHRTMRPGSSDIRLPGKPQSNTGSAGHAPAAQAHSSPI
jgi:hypothetical protein